MINVTQTFLPPIEEYNAILKRAWEKKWLTNRGELVLELEDKIKNKYHISNILATTNGTLPLQIAIKCLELKGEIITTPFSYIATTSSIIWEGCHPVFVDIDEETFNIDPLKIERAITPKTSAILATHVFGNPCKIDAIAKIAKKHNLKVIYDAAHSFGVSYNNQSIFEYGDVSTCSFHATKIFHTGEGGALFTKDKELYNKLYYHHNFGHKGALDFHGLGINAKISELQAAMGLAVFPYLEAIFERRESLYKRYQKELKGSVQFQKIESNCDYNYSYIPVVFKTEKQLQDVVNLLNNNHIYPRQYFNPSLNTIAYINGDVMPVSESISSRVLCLPLYFDLAEAQVLLISNLIRNCISNE
ncbi:DegT/DnrJ/EryC1/StrS family aminotransferase [Lacinutrix neustonica]|uniref:DegT/DnrJ/EryC1/StrS family aminotransferase n=1 Tax=Lacinutrix neustonica TaxID=2980107 RepID=A0A9E8MVT0_9FLAO|nr:DegT/DnrJ/EryC1/StrS family aminotransferase [Lacinutrix neustonica]WAC01870.1 DegT/DnrJ/EryC1/StrS family aminotransferase [Lacinutrix neustonica]